MSNRLARAEASRVPNSDLNHLNASFGNNPDFQSSLRKALEGAVRSALEKNERLVLDFYLISITNLQEQLAREIRAGILDEEALDFGGAGLFRLPYYKSSWPLYRPYMSNPFVEKFEQAYELKTNAEAEW